MNEVQRKYLRQRLESVYNQKRKDLDGYGLVDSPWESDLAKGQYVAEKLAQVGLEMRDRYAVNYITTERDRQYQAETTKRGMWLKAEQAKLNALYHKLVDEVMLGEDVETLRNALQSLENYKVEE